MYFSQNVRLLSATKGLKASHLAKELKISPQQVGRYFSGDSEPKFETAIAIARLLDVNLDDLILTDLSKESGRPFGAEGEDRASADATLDRMNTLLEQRVKQLEEEMKRENPERARELGIE
jgi:transcriptional regulator with XRE-family HTH domain